MLSKKGPMLSRLCFVDDLLLFGVASTKQASVMEGILQQFYSYLGQRVNMEKSRLLFSTNTRMDLSSRISSNLASL